MASQLTAESVKKAVFEERFGRHGAFGPIRLKAAGEEVLVEGTIDRADIIDADGTERVRIIDYKTGSVKDEEVEINDTNAAKIAEKVFGASVKSRPKIALQVEMYDMLAEKNGFLEGKKAVNSIYSMVRLFPDKVKEVERSWVFSVEVKTRLKSLLDEINDPSAPFKRTDDAETCKWCDFKIICGR